MIDISVSNLVKEFAIGEKILNGVSFQVNEGERVGLLGKNGSGKTTLLRILIGDLEQDGGEVSVAPGKRTGLISQIPVYPDGYTVQDVLLTAFRRLEGLRAEMFELTRVMEHQSSPLILKRYDALSAAFEAGGGYDSSTRLSKVCNGLDIPPSMRNQPFAALSGGEKTRVNLARLILEDTNILLLDEPTNHLDLRATEWLEDYLSRYRGTVLTVSHDRYFLDKTVSRCIELTEGKAEFYRGNYTFYTQEKEARYRETLKQYEKEEAKIAQLQQAADQLHLWAFMGNDKLHKRAFSMERRMERLRTTDRPRRERALNLRFGEQEFRGDELLTIKGLSKGYEGRTLFHGVDLRLDDGERVALLGDNGTGKSTFLKILVGEELADSGKLYTGNTVKSGYLPQIIRFSHPGRTLLDTMLYDRNCSAQDARDRLAAFGFRGEDVFKPVSALSGGEQSRLRLCMLMSSRINFLILDEPTNHLDLVSREWIEEAVEEFDGALLFVSHDRYFIRRFATRIWMLEDGRITDFAGDFEAFQAAKSGREGTQVPAVSQSGVRKEKPKRVGGTKQLEKEIAAAERSIARAEERMCELSRQMEEASTDYLKLQELYDKQTQMEEEIASLYAGWEALVRELENGT